MYYPRNSRLYTRNRRAILVRTYDGEWAKVRIDAGLRGIRLG